MAPIARRAGEFVRGRPSADLSHWLHLFGATFLFISPSLRWWPGGPFDRPLFRLWLQDCFFLLLPAMAAGSAACYLAFVGCQNPVRRLLDSVLLPALVSLVSVAGVGFYAFRGLLDPRGRGQHSVVDRDSCTAHDLLRLATNLGTAGQFAEAGLALVAIFLGLLLGRYTSLPVRLKATSNPALDDVSSAEEHRRTMLFVWMMIGLVVLSGFPYGLGWVDCAWDIHANRFNRALELRACMADDSIRIRAPRRHCPRAVHGLRPPAARARTPGGGVRRSCGAPWASGFFASFGRLRRAEVTGPKHVKRRNRSLPEYNGAGG